MSATLSIAGRTIGPDESPYVIAELSANHAQDLELAKEIVRGCAEAGVDAVKLQTYTAETMTLDVDRPEYWITQGTWASERLFDLYRRAETPWEWTRDLMSLARGLGLTLFSSPFDETAVDFLESCQVPAHKVASFELTDLPLLRIIGRTGKPVIASTGMATKDEISEAVSTLTESGCEQLALLKCTSAYPAEASDLNLTLIPQMQADFGLPVGYSDHTIGTTAAVAAVALGACVIEKHVQADRVTDSPDAAFSAAVSEMGQFVSAVREAHAMRGHAQYGPSAAEEYLRAFRRSIIATRDLQAGTLIGPDDIVVRRPDIGLLPRELDAVIGAKLTRGFARGEGLDWEGLEPVEGAERR